MISIYHTQLETAMAVEGLELKKNKDGKAVKSRMFADQRPARNAPLYNIGKSI
jgi:hypothetical protein